MRLIWFEEDLIKISGGMYSDLDSAGTGSGDDYLGNVWLKNYG